MKYELSSKNYNVTAGSFSRAIAELFKIIKEVGNVPEVSWNNEYGKTELRFEGDTCAFSLFLSEIAD